jgi:chromosome segregation ATPase
MTANKRGFPMSEPEEVLQLRACRAEVEGIKKELEDAREQQAKLEEKINSLLAKQREARMKRREAVLAADAAGVPRLRISKEVGMQRSNVYKLLEGADTSDDS